MIRRLSSAVPALLVCAALLAGCGSSSSSSGNTATTSGSTATSASSSSTAATSPAKVPASAATIAKCKQGANVLPTLPQATKSKLEAICEKAASGDRNAVRTAAREACEEIVKASPLPAGAIRDRALSKCKQAGAAVAGAGG